MMLKSDSGNKSSDTVENQCCVTFHYSSLTTDFLSYPIYSRGSRWKYLIYVTASKQFKGQDHATITVTSSNFDDKIDRIIKFLTEALMTNFFDRSYNNSYMK